MALNWRFHQDDEGLGSLWKYRCEICTLRCPCPHVPRYRLAEMNKKRVSQYPLNADAEICHEFFRTKYCTSYEVRGWCHFAHPVPNLVMPVRRCDVCTKKITKKYCYLHRPPIGECVGDDDKAVLTIGSDVKEKFKPGEIDGEYVLHDSHTSIPLPDENNTKWIKEDVGTCRRFLDSIYMKYPLSYGDSGIVSHIYLLYSNEEEPINLCNKLKL